MMKTTVAVIGCGRIANIAHLPAFRRMANVRVKYACDIIEGKAKALKKRFPFIEQTITDYKIALADNEVDAVYVLTPNSVHYEITVAALRAGKHVLCEKPVTVNYALSLKMAEEAEKQGKILNIGVCNRYNKSVEMLESLYREGRFGTIYHVCCSFRKFRAIPELGGDFTTKATSGGGVLIDWGIHFLDLVLYVLGGPKLITATSDAYNEMAKNMPTYKYNKMWAKADSNIYGGTNDVEDFISGYVRTDKAGISLNGAWAQNINAEEMYIDFLGDKAGARLQYRGKFKLYDGATLRTIAPRYAIKNPYLREDMAFITSIQTGVYDRNNIVYILESMKLLDALYLSAGTGKEVEFGMYDSLSATAKNMQ